MMMNFPPMCIITLPNKVYVLTMARKCSSFGALSDPAPHITRCLRQGKKACINGYNFSIMRNDCNF